MNVRVFAGGRALVGDPPRMRRVDVTVCDGRIVALEEPGASLPAPAELVDVRGRYLLPGLVNAHTHAYSSLCRHLVPGRHLEPWMPLTQAAATTMGPDELAVASQLNAIESLRHGVTTTLDHATLTPDGWDAVIGAYAETGARVVLALQVQDLGPGAMVPPDDDTLAARIAELVPVVEPPCAAELIERTEAFLDATTGTERLTGLVGPSAPERCSDALLDGLATLASSREVGVHTHLLETPAQRRQPDLVGRLADHGLLTARTTVAHGVHLDDHDRARLARAGASVVHDPFCNLLLGSGRLELAQLLEAGVHVGIGTDGWSTGGVQSVLDQGRLALALGRPELAPDRWPTTQQIWSLLTEGSARAVALPGQVGRLEMGAHADLLVVDPGLAGWLDYPDPVTQIVLGGFGAGLERVVVGGRDVLTEGMPHGIDYERLRWVGSQHAARSATPSAGVLERAHRLAEVLEDLDGTRNRT